MDENVIVTTFSEDSRAYEALARLKELAAKDQIDLHDGTIGLSVLEHISRSIGNGETAVLDGRVTRLVHH
jgi:hypothetical protein